MVTEEVVEKYRRVVGKLDIARQNARVVGIDGILIGLLQPEWVFHLEKTALRTPVIGSFVRSHHLAMEGEG